MDASNLKERTLTREELAVVLKVSVRTVDAMVAAGEVPHMRVGGDLVRFYLPDVIRHLTANALTRKRGRMAAVGREERGVSEGEEGATTEARRH
jgi:excisionase family DNA binding protein